MEDKRFKTLEEYQDEYWDEYINGENIDILEFLKRKKQEALETGEQKLAEHIETIYNEAYEEEKFDENVYEEEQLTMQDDDEVADDYDESQWYEAYLNRWIEGYKKELEADGEEKYEEYLKEIAENKERIKEYEEELKKESLDEEDRYDYESSISRCKKNIEEYTSEIKEIEFKREIVQFVTSLKSMTPEEIEEEYVSLLEERDAYTFVTDMADDGIEVPKDKLRINRDKIGLIEAYAIEFPEIQKLIQAQKEKYERMAEKRKQTEKELLESMEYEEALRTAPISETALDKMLHKTKTQEELENMSEEELQQLIANNSQTIEENNSAIKKALIERIIAQQETISEQQLEINRLNSQKKEL